MTLKFSYLKRNLQFRKLEFFISFKRFSSENGKRSKTAPSALFWAREFSDIATVELLTNNRRPQRGDDQREGALNHLNRGHKNLEPNSQEKSRSYLLNSSGHDPPIISTIDAPGSYTTPPPARSWYRGQ